MTKKYLYITAAVLALGTVLVAAWWGWSQAGLAVLQLDMGVC
ncbi:MAG: hypothetical protein RBQ83_07280 [Pseudomonas sp.]|jgi:hypothetical protein|nr:hypothetical protein [Pseudomonas sp.]